MTRTLQSKIFAQVGWTWRDGAGASPVVDSSRLKSDVDLADGSGSGQADAVWHAESRILTAGSAETLDLDALESELFDNTLVVSLAKVKALVIVNRNITGSGHLAVGAAAIDPWHEPFGDAGDTVKVMPGSPLLLANVLDGWDVDAGATGLRIAAVGDDVTYDIAVLGTIADGGSSSSGA